ncbi:hypothetical protein [Microbacterium allomyrinae]|uniref:Uncharacterized protein n=1 Tax=Microbacterium allomyrinae TaxID=2830666 RepID=A0A9X1LXU7_9MICO|nr:hypothetical protein [Microbacterium allomyrinae]MCC2034134.1 hypothetical protein [Microbacterium allomyrinae]
MSEVTDRDPLDLLLNDAVPPTSEMTPEVAHQLDLLVARSMPTSRRGRRSWRRPLAVGVMSLLIIGGATTATAAVTGVWPLWAETPDAVAHFTLPSGAQCEYRVGNTQGLDAEAVEVVTAHYRSLDTSKLLNPGNVAAMVAQIREEEATAASDGTMDGAANAVAISADSEYRLAAWRLIHEDLESKLTESGVDTGDLMSEGQFHCPGAEW